MVSYRLRMKFLIVFSTIFVVAFAQKLPSSFKRCSSEDIKCLTEAVQDAIPRFKNGIQEFGIPSLDPLFIPEMSIGSGQKVIQLQQKYKNVTLVGLTSSNVTGFRFNLKDQSLQLYTTADQLLISGYYEATGKILLLPVKGHGPFSIFLENPVGTLHVHFETYTKKGKKHIKGNQATLIIDVDHASYKFQNLFEMNKDIEDGLSKVLNDNWREIFDELVPTYTDAYAQALLQVFNRFFAKVPLSEVFLDH